jgi:hypothetical protein
VATKVVKEVGRTLAEVAAAGELTKTKVVVVAPAPKKPLIVDVTVLVKATDPLV